MNRRTFLQGMVATAAGILVPQAVAAEPERRIWALDRTMMKSPCSWENGCLETGWFEAGDPYDPDYDLALRNPHLNWSGKITIGDYTRDDDGILWTKTEDKGWFWSSNGNDWEATPPWFDPTTI